MAHLHHNLNIQMMYSNQIPFFHKNPTIYAPNSVLLLKFQSETKAQYPQKRFGLRLRNQFL